MSNNQEYVILVPKEYCRGAFLPFGNILYPVAFVSIGQDIFGMVLNVQIVSKLALHLITNKMYFNTAFISKALYDKAYIVHNL